MSWVSWEERDVRDHFHEHSTHRLWQQSKPAPKTMELASFSPQRLTEDEWTFLLPQWQHRQILVLFLLSGEVGNDAVIFAESKELCVQKEWCKRVEARMF
jgi:hypothetical protein